MIKEEIGLLKEVKEGKLNWQSKAWILERKFDEWNIKHQQEFSGSIAIKGNEIKFKDFDESKPEGE